MMTVNSGCRICGHTYLIKWLDLGEQPPANAFVRPEDLNKPEPHYPLEVYWCQECNLAQLIHIVDKVELFSNYIYFSSGMPTLSDHFRRYVEDLMARFLTGPTDLVVEIGSNDGVLLHWFKQHGYRILGIDPARNVASVAEARGVPTIVDFFSERLAEQIAGEQGRAMALIGNNVVAHINDYYDLSAAVKTILAPSGVFVFEAPYLIDMFENLTFDTVYHEHLNYLAIRPLQRLLARYGLEIFEVKIVSSHGQSLRVFVGHAGAHPIDQSVGACVGRELSVGLDKRETYQALAERIAAAKAKTLGQLRQWKAAGKRLAAYGAPAKGSTVLNYYGVGTELLDFALDELPSKQGLYTPGTHLPVIDRAYAMAHAPDYYFLLAWNYLPIILEKERAWVEGGRAFLLPSGEVVRG